MSGAKLQKSIVPAIVLMVFVMDSTYFLIENRYMMVSAHVGS